jgi:hypothetical protein
MISETYPEEFLDIDFLSNLLFDYIYTNEKDQNKCYSLTPIKKEDLLIENIKLIGDRVKQKQLINNVFNAKLVWLWRKNNLYTFKRQMDVYSTNVQIKLVNNLDSQQNINSSENINSLVTWLLSDLVILKKTKCILLNLMNFDVTLDLLSDFIDNYPEVNADFIDINDKKNKIVNVTVMEHFFKTELLSEIINSLSWNEIKSIIFQIAHVLALIQETYPGFRKNNLTLDTVFLYHKKPKQNDYIIGDKKIILSDQGYEVKLGFFSESYIPGYAENEDLIEDKQKLDNTYDILMFLDDLSDKVKDNEIKKHINVIIKNIQKNDKNIILSNIIMNHNFLDIQKGGKKSSRTIKGIRYISNNNQDSIFLKSKSKDDNLDLPDSLSSLNSSENNYKFSEEEEYTKPKAYNMQSSQQMMGMPTVNPMTMD